MCGQNASKVSSQSGPPQVFLDAYQNVLDQAKGVAGQTLQQYPIGDNASSIVAPFSADQSKAYNTIRDLQGQYQPTLATATNYLTQAGTPVTPLSLYYRDNLPAQGLDSITQAQNEAYSLPGVVQPYLDTSRMGTPDNYARNLSTYMSPYTQDVTSSLQNLFNQQNAEQLNQVKGNAIAQHAYGGDREAIAEAETARQQQLGEAPALASALQQGYAQAASTLGQQQQLGLAGGQLALGSNLSGGQLNLAAGQGLLGEWNTQQQTDLQAQQANDWIRQGAGYGLANLSQLGQNLGLSGASALLGAGGQQQAQAQQVLNVPYEQFIQRQAYPFQTTGWLSNIAEGLGGSSGGTSSTKYPGPSAISQIGGLGAAGAGILGATGAFGSDGYLTNLFGGGGGSGGISDFGGGGASFGVPDVFGVNRGGRIGRADGGALQVPFDRHYAPGGLVPDLSLSIIPGASGLGTPPSSGAGGGLHSAFFQPVTTQTQSGGGGGILGALGPIASIAKIGASFLADGGGVDDLSGVFTNPNRKGAGPRPDDTDYVLAERHNPYLDEKNTKYAIYSGGAPPPIDRPVPHLDRPVSTLLGWRSGPDNPPIWDGPAETHIDPSKISEDRLDAGEGLFARGGTAWFDQGGVVDNNNRGLSVAPPDLSKVYIPTTNAPGGSRMGPPAAPSMSAQQQQNPLGQGEQLAKTVTSLSKLFDTGSDKSNGGFVDPTAQPLQHFDGGGSVSPMMAANDLEMRQRQQADMLRQYQNMPIEQLQELAVRYPPTTPQGIAVQRALQLRRMSPNAAGAGGPVGPNGPAGEVTPGTTAADGGGMGLEHYANGGELTKRLAPLNPMSDVDTDDRDVGRMYNGNFFQGLLDNPPRPGDHREPVQLRLPGFAGGGTLSLADWTGIPLDDTPSSPLTNGQREMMYGSPGQQSGLAARFAPLGDESMPEAVRRSITSAPTYSERDNIKSPVAPAVRDLYMQENLAAATQGNGREEGLNERLWGKRSYDNDERTYPKRSFENAAMGFDSFADGGEPVATADIPERVPERSPDRKMNSGLSERPPRDDLPPLSFDKSSLTIPIGSAADKAAPGDLSVPPPDTTPPPAGYSAAPPSAGGAMDANTWAAKNKTPIGLDDKGALVPQDPRGNPIYDAPGFPYDRGQGVAPAAPGLAASPDTVTSGRAAPISPTQAPEDYLATRIMNAEGTGGGNPWVVYGGDPFQPGAEHPGELARRSGPEGVTHAAGPGQWQPGTWNGLKPDFEARYGRAPVFADMSDQKKMMWLNAAKVYPGGEQKMLADIQGNRLNTGALAAQWAGFRSNDGTQPGGGGGRGPSDRSDVLIASGRNAPSGLSLVSSSPGTSFSPEVMKILTGLSKGNGSDSTGSDLYRSPWMPLVAIGAGMLASRSPHAGVALGEGLQTGLKALGQQQKEIPENQLKQTQADVARLNLGILPLKMQAGIDTANAFVNGTPAPSGGGSAPVIPTPSMGATVSATRPSAATGSADTVNPMTAANSAMGQILSLSASGAAPTQIAQAAVGAVGTLPTPAPSNDPVLAEYDRNYAAIKQSIRQLAPFEPEKLPAMMESYQKLFMSDPRNQALAERMKAEARLPTDIARAGGEEAARLPSKKEFAQFETGQRLTQKAGETQLELQPYEVALPGGAGSMTLLAPKSQVLAGMAPGIKEPLTIGNMIPQGKPATEGGRYDPDTESLIAVAPPPGVTAQKIELSEAAKGKLTEDHKTLEGYRKAAQEVPMQMVRINDLNKLIDQTKTGRVAEAGYGLAAWAKAAGMSGLIPEGYDPSNIEQINKLATQLVFSQIKQIGGRVLVTEIDGLSRANPNVALTPEANRAILQNVALEQQLAQDRYLNASKVFSRFKQLGNFDEKYIANTPASEIEGNIRKQLAPAAEQQTQRAAGPLMPQGFPQNARRGTDGGWYVPNPNPQDQTHPWLRVVPQ